MCVFLWSLRLPAREDAKLPCVQLCGFFPLWVSMCVFRIKGRGNESPHSAHFCTFLPVCVTIWFLNVPLRPNDFLHSEQVYVFSSRHCGWVRAFLGFQLHQMNFCSWMPFLWCGFKFHIPILKNDSFKKTFRIIPWLWKRVLHLVWAFLLCIYSSWDDFEHG